MEVLKISAITIRQRQRRSMNRVALEDLKSSILSRGLLQAPVVWYDAITRSYILCAGERRLTALRELYEEKEIFDYDSTTFADGEIPVTILTNPTKENIVAAELEENLMREDLSWVDTTRALAQIVHIRSAQGQTMKDTAEELATKGIAIGTAKASTTLRKAMVQATALEPHLDNPEIAKARNAGEAYQKVLKQDQERIHALVRERAQDATTVLHFGDARKLMPEMEDGQFDLILTDPPYGIGADTGGFRTKSPLAHEYDDSHKAAAEIQQAILLEGFRLAKKRANLIMFCDVDNLTWLKETCQRIGWQFFRTPIIWNKTQTEGIAPWGTNGFLRTYEMIFFATKGQRGLLKATPDVIFASRVPRSKRVFAAQKPYELLHTLITISTLEGDTVFDPCAGSGATLRAAKLLQRPAVGIEMERSTYNTAMSFIDHGITDIEDAKTSVSDEDII